MTPRESREPGPQPALERRAQRRPPRRAPRRLWAALATVALAGAACGRPAPVPFERVPLSVFQVEWQPVLLPTHLRLGERRAVDVTVTNTGAATWPPSGGGQLYGVRLAHRWIRGSDSVVVADFGDRAKLPGPVPPGGRVTVRVLVVAPTAPGDYIVQFDLVQEGVAWFGTRGAALKYALVKVE